MKMYNFQKFFRNIMSWVLLLCILGVILYIILKKSKAVEYVQ